MLINKDIYHLDLFRDGMHLHELLRDSSRAFVEQLEAHEVIYIDNIDSRVYLTPKGEVVRKIGLEKYLELERLEQKYLAMDSQRLRIRNKLFLVLMLFLISVLTYLLSVTVAL